MSVRANCVCLCAYACMCVHAYILACACVYSRECTRVCINVCVYLSLCIITITEINGPRKFYPGTYLLGHAACPISEGRS